MIIVALLGKSHLLIISVIWTGSFVFDNLAIKLGNFEMYFGKVKLERDILGGAL